MLHGLATSRWSADLGVLGSEGYQQRRARVHSITRMALVLTVGAGRSQGLHPFGRQHVQLLKHGLDMASTVHQVSPTHHTAHKVTQAAHALRVPTIPCSRPCHKPGSSRRCHYWNSPQASRRVHNRYTPAADAARARPPWWRALGWQLAPTPWGQGAPAGPWPRRGRHGEVGRRRPRHLLAGCRRPVWCPCT